MLNLSFKTFFEQRKGHKMKCKIVTLVIALCIGSGCFSKSGHRITADAERELFWGGEKKKYANQNGRRFVASTKIIEGCTPLMIAAGKRDLPEVKRLIENGADVNERSVHGNTPLMFSMCGLGNLRGKFEMVKYLIENGADIHAENNHHQAPLYHALAGSDKEVWEYLIELQAKFVPIDVSGMHFWGTARCYLKMAEYYEQENLIDKSIEDYNNASVYFEKAALENKAKIKMRDFRNSLIPMLLVTLSSTANVLESSLAKQRQVDFAEIAALRHASDQGLSQTQTLSSISQYKKNLTKEPSAQNTSPFPRLQTKNNASNPLFITHKATSAYGNPRIFLTKCKMNHFAEKYYKYNLNAIRCYQIAECYKNHASMKEAGECLENIGPLFKYR